MGKVKDICGQTINHWYVIKEVGRSKSGSATFLCRCLLCGTEKVVEGRSIRTGASKCCGCVHPKRVETTRHEERLYGVWRGMNDRCYNTHSKFFHRYGGRGIKICNEWLDYNEFKKWAYANGYDDSAAKYDCTINRIDNDGNYSPSNCRWSNQSEQCNNKSDNHLITYKGETHTITEWSKMVGLRKDTLRRRLINYQWPIERALFEPNNHTL